MVKKLFLLFYYGLQGVQMFFECMATPFGYFIFRVGLSLNKGLGYGDVFLSFQRFDVRSEVAIGDPEQFLQGVEFISIVGDQHGHDL